MLNDPEIMTGSMWALVTVGMFLGFLALVIITVVIIKAVEKHNKKKRRKKQKMRI